MNKSNQRGARRPQWLTLPKVVNILGMLLNIRYVEPGEEAAFVAWFQANGTAIRKPERVADLGRVHLELLITTGQEPLDELVTIAVEVSKLVRAGNVGASDVERTGAAAAATLLVLAQLDALSWVRPEDATPSEALPIAETVSSTGGDA